MTRNRVIAAVAVVVLAVVLGAVGFTTRASADPSGPTMLPPGTPALSSCKTVKLKSTGPCVKAVQDSLNLLNIKVQADGKFGPQTDGGVRQFQTTHGLKPVDGIAGPATMAALHQALLAPRPAKAPATVQGLQPNGTIMDGGVFHCGNLFGTCSFYFDRTTTKRMADWLEKNEIRNDQGTFILCGAIGFGKGKGKGFAIAEFACGLFEVTKGNEFKKAVKDAAKGNGCARISWWTDPPLPHKAYNDGGRNCLTTAVYTG